MRDRIFSSPRDALFKLWAAGAAKLLTGYAAEQRAVVDPGLIATATEGERITAVDYLGADLVRTALGEQMAAEWEKSAGADGQQILKRYRGK